MAHKLSHKLSDDALEAHNLHADPKQHAGDCGFCAIAVQDAEHRAYLDATPGAYEHAHGPLDD